MTSKVREWLENYRRERQEKTTTTPGKLDLGKVLNTSPSKKKATPKSKRGLILEQQENVQPDITAGNQPQMQPPSSPPRKLPLQPGLHSPLRQSFPRNSAMDQGLTTPQSPLKLPLGNQPNSAAAVVKPQSPLRPHQPRDLSKGPAAAPPSPLRNQNGAALFLSRSPVKHSRSILEERLALPPSSSSPKRRLLTTTPSPSSRGNKCAGVLNPKKRWLIEVFQVLLDIAHVDILGLDSMCTCNICCYQMLKTLQSNESGKRFFSWALISNRNTRGRQQSSFTFKVVVDLSEILNPILQHCNLTGRTGFLMLVLKVVPYLPHEVKVKPWWCKIHTCNFACL